MLRFTDGVNINTQGTLRILHLKDGYYVVGEGMCCPVDSRAEGQQMIDEMNDKKARRAN